MKLLNQIIAEAATAFKFGKELVPRINSPRNRILILSNMLMELY